MSSDSTSSPAIKIMAGPSSTRTPLRAENTSPEFGNSGFFFTEGLSGLQPSQLTGSIHPIFSQSNFRSTEFVYRKLVLALRLATALIIAGLPFFHSMLFSKCKKIRGNKGEVYYVFPDPLTKLTEVQAAQTWEMLILIGRQITFHGDPDIDGRAVCRLIPESSGCFNPKLPGCRSEISFKQQFLQNVINGQSDPNDIVSEQFWSFAFASTMIHELTHAVHYAMTPLAAQPAQFFMGENGKSTEMGSEMEAYLFGGMTPTIAFDNEWSHYDKDRKQWSSLKRMITFSEHPCPSHALFYERHEECLNLVYRGGHEASVEILWNVSFPQINRLFQDSFWTGEFMTQGRHTLWFERETAYRFQAMRTENRVPILPHPSETADIPEGYFADKNGLIQKKSSDKMAKIEKSYSRQADVDGQVRKIVSTGIMDTDWKPMTFAEKADALYRHASTKAKQSAEEAMRSSSQMSTKWKKNTADTLRSTAEASSKAKESAKQTLLTALTTAEVLALSK